MNRRLRQILILALVGVGFAWIYRSTFTALVKEWMSSAEASYGLILATTAIVVAIRRWPAFVEASSAEGRGLAGLGLSAFGALLFAVGQLGSDLFLTRVSLVVLLAGAVWTLTGSRATRAMAAPLA